MNKPVIDHLLPFKHRVYTKYQVSARHNDYNFISSLTRTTTTKTYRGSTIKTHKIDYKSNMTGVLIRTGKFGCRVTDPQGRRAKEDRDRDLSGVSTRQRMTKIVINHRS